MRLWLILIFLMQFCLIGAVKINTTQYFRMPKLYKFDDYDECFGSHNDDALYCIAKAQIQQNESSELYNYIMQFNSDQKHHFRHDKLMRGLCMNLCHNFKTILNGSELNKYYVGSQNHSTDVNYINAFNYRNEYSEDDVNICINKELVDIYGLKALTSIEYCVTTKDDLPLDNYDIIVAFLLVALVGIVISSSLYDRYLRNCQDSYKNLKASQFYKSTSELKSKYHQVLTIFSIRRNWSTLSSPSKAEFHDLKIFQWARTFTFCCVILGHCFPFNISLPSHNPIYIENFYTKITSMFIINGNVLVQTFFFISGFLSAYLFMLQREKERCSNWLFFIKAVIFRYIRLTPLLLFMILLHSTWLFRAGDGPFWNYFVLEDRELCRENWWINLIFLNNYINVHKICMFHSWYLATDFWLSVFAYFCLIIIFKKPKLRNWILSSVISMSIIITAYVTYVNKFEPIPILSPEAFRNKLIPPANASDPDYFKYQYVPTHMNIGNYFIGVMSGLWYRDIKISNLNFTKNLKYRFLWYICVIVGFMIVLSAYFFYEYDFQKPSIWISVASVLLKHGWGIILAFGTVGVINHYGWFARNLLSYDGFKIFGRISYASFVCHIFVLKILMFRSHQMIELSMQNMFTTSVACFVFSNMFGLILTLCIEMPISTILKMFTLKRSDSIEQIESATKNSSCETIDSHHQSSVTK